MSETDNSKKAKSLVGAADPVLYHQEAGVGTQSKYHDDVEDHSEEEKFSGKSFPKAPDHMPFTGLKGGSGA
jgi:hypothetical protein